MYSVYSMVKNDAADLPRRKLSLVERPRGRGSYGIIRAVMRHQLCNNNWRVNNPA